jgi:hypothetical protein
LTVNGTDLKYDFLRKEARQAGVRSSDHIPVIILKLQPFFAPITRWALEQIRDHAVSGGARMMIFLVPAAIDTSVTATDFDSLHQGTDNIGVPVIDLRNTFRSVNDIHDFQVVPEGDIHPNARGHVMIFDSLYAQLKSQGVWQTLAGADAGAHAAGDH